MVRLLEELELQDVMKHWVFSKHAIVRIDERVEGKTFEERERKLKKMILDKDFGYINTDGCYNIATGKDTYIVVKPLECDYLVITYKEPSHNKYTVREKFNLALKGVQR